MTEDRDLSAAMGRRERPERDSQDAEAIAISALTFLGGDVERLGRFLALTGLDPASLRAAAREPNFLASVLDHLIADEALLLAFSANARLRPEEVLRARARLGGLERWSD